MAFSSGTFTLVAGNPVTTNTTISSTWANTTLSDVASGLSSCVLKDGTQTITANVPMGGFKFTGLGAGSASGNSLRYEQVNGVVTTAGDLLQASAAGTLARLALGAAGTIPMSRTASAGLAYVAALSKNIYGLTYDVGTDTVNDLNINTGGAMDATGAYWMTLATALGKQSDAVWAVGGTTAAPLGGLDLIGSAGNNDFYIWLIARSDTGVVDALYSLSSTAPTMPANYDFKRLIGWFKRAGGTVVAFHTYETEGGGIEMNWDSPTLDVNLSNTLTTARRTDAVKVPLNFSTIAHLNVQVSDGTTNFVAWIYCPDQSDLAPSGAVAPLNNFGFNIAGTNGPSMTADLRVRTSATGTIAARASLATVDGYLVSTMGFTWARRN